MCVQTITCELRRCKTRLVCFIAAEKGAVARAKGEAEKEKEFTTDRKSRRRRDEKAPWALNYESGREEVMRKGGGEEVRSV